MAALGCLGEIMMQVKNSRELALKEYVLDGNPVTSLEGMVLFGLPNTTAAISALRKQGYLIKTSRVPFVRALRRINEVAVLVPAQDLPVKELALTEYQLSR